MPRENFKSAAPIIIQLLLFYSPLKSCFDGPNHQAYRESHLLQYSLNLLFRFLVTPGQKWSVTQPSFFAQSFTCHHLHS